jgi:hypothetical protein
MTDYEVEDGDDDLFADNVDTSVNDHNDVQDDFQLENDQALDDTDLNLRGGSATLAQQIQGI